MTKARNWHTVRSADGKTVEIRPYGRKIAMSAMCTECLGFETNPAECTSPLCPLFPFRVRTQKTREGD